MNVPDAAAIRAALRCGQASCRCARGRQAHCPVAAHRDRHPSCVVDESNGRVLVHCHGGCVQDDVIESLRVRGLWPTGTRNDHRPAAMTKGGTGTSPRSAMAEARAAVLELARRQAWAAPGLTDIYTISDCTRCLRRRVGLNRRIATQKGPSDETWGLLEAAAADERLVLNLEATVDGMP